MLDDELISAGEGEAGDERLLVKFYLKSREDRRASQEAGRPVFKEVEYIDIRIPGTRAAGVARPATDADRQRFPKHYAAFKNRQEMPVEGTPLSEWPAITRAQVDELSFHNIKTVEQLVNLNDAHAQNFMGIQDLKRRAKAFLEAATKQSLADEMARRDERIAELEQRLEAMQAQLNAASEPTEPEIPDEPARDPLGEPMTVSPPRRRGRPRKIATQ